MRKLVKRQVCYFDEPGAGNTRSVIEAVSQRLDNGGIKGVVVASTSGETAVKFARALKSKAEVICVSQAPYRREWSEGWPCLKPELRQEMEKLGVAIIDRAPYVLHSSLLENAPWNDAFPERLVRETLYCFGQGLKVAVEIALAGVSCGYIIPYEDVIGVGGTGKGADTAIILRATYPPCMFDKDPAKRLEIREIIAMPLSRKWWG